MCIKQYLYVNKSLSKKRKLTFSWHIIPNNQPLNDVNFKWLILHIINIQTIFYKYEIKIKSILNL